MRYIFKSTGIVFIFIITLNTYFSQAQTLKGNILYGDAEEDYFGESVCMPDPNTLAIGASLSDINGDNSGIVKVYSWIKGDWIQKGDDIKGDSIGNNFGRTICMPNKNTIGIGAIGGNKVCIYTWGGNSWVQKGNDILKSYGAFSGTSISMPNDSTIAIGTTMDLYNNSGFASIYNWDGKDWIQKGDDIFGQDFHVMAGTSVSMPDANTIAIGSPSSKITGKEAGQVRVFEWNGGKWIQKGSDINGDTAFSYLGTSISMPDANTLAVNNGGHYTRDKVKIFTWSGNDWIPKGQVIYSDSINNNFGYSLCMPDPRTIAIGSPGDFQRDTSTGKIQIFAWTGTEWLKKGKAIYGKVKGDNCGASVCMPEANTIAIGSPSNDKKGNLAGQARVFTFCNNSTSNVTQTSCDSFGSPSGKYTWVKSGTYYDTITNYAGCDSLLSINLTITKIDISVQNNSPTLSAKFNNSSYQWLDCNNSMKAINGKNNQSFTASKNGSYAVEIRKNGCLDTSECIIVSNASIEYINQNNPLVLYPNPGNGTFTIQMDKKYSNTNILIKNSIGQQVQQYNFKNSDKIQFNILGQSGIYIIDITTEERKKTLRLVKSEHLNY